MISQLFHVDAVLSRVLIISKFANRTKFYSLIYSLMNTFTCNNNIIKLYFSLKKKEERNQGNLTLPIIKLN